MKKLSLILIVLTALFTTSSASAAGFSDDWAYAFHLQSENGVLSPDKSSGEYYTPIPELYVSSVNPSSSDYYGLIKSIKGKEVARFGFNEPQTTVSLLGKSLFDVKAPFFANADHVEFYTKNGKKLFDISVRGSSFCNDNATCNADVGETYLNCPADCPPPPPPVETPPETTPTTTAVAPTVTPTSSGQQIPVTVSQDPNSGNSLIGTPSKTTITLLVLGLLSLILIFILWKLRGFRDE